MTVIFVDADGNPDPPLDTYANDNPALLWIGPADAPPVAGATAVVPAEYLDGGIIDLPDLTGGRFTLRCHETTRAVVDASSAPGRYNLVIDAVDGVSRVRRYLPNVELGPLSGPSSSPSGEPMGWTFTASFDPDTVTTSTETPDLT